MKKIIIILIIFALVITGGITWLNQVYLPKTIKALIISGIEDQTNTRASLDSVKVNIFKGLVLRNLVLAYNNAEVIKVKEASCIFLPWGILQKKIIIPGIHLNSAHLFVERRSDGTFNLQDLFQPKPSSETAEPVKPSPESAESKPVKASATLAATKDQGFSVSVYKVKLTNSRIIFKDSTFKEPFIKSIDNLNLSVYLSLPNLIKFKMLAQVKSNPLSSLSALGEYRIPNQELNAKISVQNIAPHDYSVYYQASGLNITGGLINALINLKLKEGLINSDLQLQARGLAVVKDNITVKSSLDAKGSLGYNLETKELKYSGSANLINGEVLGVETIDKISNINAKINFDNLGLNTEAASASIFGLPVQINLKLNNFNDPVLSIGGSITSDLSIFSQLLKEELKLIPPGAFSGKSNLSVSATGKLAEAGEFNIIGYLDFIDASLKPDKFDYPIHNINGRVAFTKDQAQWKDLSFEWQGSSYKTTGGVTNFESPFFEVGLDSKDFNISTSFSIVDKLINISKCSGRYLNSDFSLSGSVNTATAPDLLLDLSGNLLVDLNDLHKPLNKFKDQLDKINPKGKARVQFNLTGKSGDLENCVIESKLSASDISLYGFNGKEMVLSYSQKDKIIDISLARLSLYGGDMSASFKLNMQSKNYPYWFNLAMQGVDIKELKLDTSAKDKDIAGIIQGEFKASGFLSDIINSEGLGSISITKGKLWELDLFKGLGKLLFTQDFTNIIFYEGSCAFIMRDKYVSTDNLAMKSNMVDLSGPVRIGFDNSINGALNVDMVNELLNLTGTYKDVTKAILGKTNRFAVIKVSGTLKDPKYKFEAQVGNIIKGLSDMLFKKNSD